MEETLSTIRISQAERLEAISAQLEQAHVLSKDEDIAFLIELVGGLAGLLGLGYIYAGMTTAGVVRLIGFWVLATVLWVSYMFFSAITLGFGLCLFFVPLAIHLGAIFISANDLKKSVVIAKAAAHASGATATLPTPSTPPTSLSASPLQDESDMDRASLPPDSPTT